MRLSRFARSFSGSDPLRITVPFALLSLSVVLAGVWRAASLRWLSDDIFITFRYIDQWFVGNGLVYNPGEYVEGYTHPLWLLLLSGWRLLGMEMEAGSMTLGVAAQCGLLITLVYASWKMAGRAKTAIPATAAAVALHYEASVWATGGLETALFVCLISIAVVIYCLTPVSDDSRRLVVGSLLVLATLTRPDGALFLLTMAVVEGVRIWGLGEGSRGILRGMRAVMLPALILVPYGIWKLSYYGDVLPNTYYAKSGGGSYFSQGFTYIWLYLKGYPSTVLSLAGVAALVASFRTSDTVRLRIRSVFSDRRILLSAVCLLFSVVYLFLFVARVGGDFMYGRFIIPVVPLLYLSAESGIRKLLGRRMMAMSAALVMIPLLVGSADVVARGALFTADDTGQVTLGDGTTGIIDEHAYWSRPLHDDGTNAIGMLTAVGDSLRTYFEGETVRILVKGQASLAYASRASEVIENWGLTDKVIAHLSVHGRGRVGHEKEAPYGYLLDRHVHFFFFAGEPPPDMSSFRVARFRLPYGWSAAEMYIYDRELMSSLRDRFPEAVRFTDFAVYLDEYIRTADKRSRAEVEHDLEEFRDFYFRHNADPDREKELMNILRSKSG